MFWCFSCRTINWVSPATLTLSPGVPRWSSRARAPPSCSSRWPSLWRRHRRCRMSSFCKVSRSTSPIHFNKIRRILTIKIWDLWAPRDCCQRRLEKVCVKVAPSAHVSRQGLHKVDALMSFFFSPPKKTTTKKSSALEGTWRHPFSKTPPRREELFFFNFPSKDFTDCIR